MVPDRQKEPDKDGANFFNLFANIIHMVIMQLRTLGMRVGDGFCWTHAQIRALGHATRKLLLATPNVPRSTEPYILSCVMLHAIFMKHFSVVKIRTLDLHGVTSYKRVYALYLHGMRPTRCL